MEEDDLPTGAQRYRYRVVIDHDPSPRPAENGRKRTGEPIIPPRRVFMGGTIKRVPVIELSSDGDSPPPERRASASAAPVQQITPITVDSTDEETTAPVVGSGLTEEEVFDSLFGDIEMEGTSTAGTSQQTLKPSLDKGKGKEAATDLAVFDLQEELECIICCTLGPPIYADGSDIINRPIYLFALRSWRMWTLWYVYFVLRLICSLSMAR